MSSVETSAILAAISAMETQLAALRAQISGKTPAKPQAASGKTPAAPKEKKEKKETTNPWVLFTARVRSVLKEAGYEKKTLGPEAVVFCGELKKENGDFASWADEEILARRAAWTAPEIAKKGSGKKSAGSGAASVASDADADAAAPSEEPAKKKRGPPKGVKLSEEEKAKRKATREANKAKKDAASASASASEDEEEAPASDGEAAASTTSSEKKKRGPPKGVKLSEEEKAKRKATREANKAKKKEAPASPSLSAATVPLPPSPPMAPVKTAPANFQPVMLKDESGKPARYYINLQTGHAYHRSEDGTQGHWAGLFSKTPKPHIDHSVAEPEAELSFTDLDQLD